MKRATLFFISISISLMLIGQNFQPQMDDNGCVIRTQKSYNIEKACVPSKEPNEWLSIGPYGGDVHDIAVNPMDVNIIIAAAGIPFISYDGGGTWELLENLANLAPNGIQTIEASSNGSFYAAGLSSSSKIYRSTDGGETWEQKTIPVNSSGLDITIDPNDPNVIYMGLTTPWGGTGNKLIVKSEDGGDTWTSFDLISVFPVGWEVVNLRVDPDDSQIIFAIGNESFSNAQVVASFDGGLSWEIKTGNLPSNAPYNSLTISEQDIYIAGGQLFGGQIMGIYKTEDYGLTWQYFSTGFPNLVSNAILIDPENTDYMYVATEGDGIYYTNDGGSVWNYNTAGAGDNGAARCLVFEPGNTDVIYAGFLSFGICKSVDAAQSWVYTNKGIATLQTDDVEVNPNDPLNILIGFEAMNSGGCYLSGDGGESWELVSGLPGTRFSQVTFGSDESMYAWSNGPSSVAQEGLYKSIDGGQSWTNTGPNIGNLFETEIFALAASKTNPDLLFIGGNNFGVNGSESMIYRTTDGGGFWENVYMGPEYHKFRYLFIDPNSEDEVIYAAFQHQGENAGFLKSIDGGDNWITINTGIPATNKWSAAIVCDPANSDILYGGVGGYGNLNGTIYKSINAGDLWTQTSLELGTYSQISDIILNPTNSDVLYISTSQNGVYTSIDAGENWETANEGLSASGITGFSNSFEKDDLWYFCASTYSNSAFKTEMAGSINTSIQKISDGTEQFTIYPNPSNGAIFFETSNEKINIVSLSIYNTQGKLIRYFDDSNFNNPVSSLSLELSPNIYLCRVVSEGKVYTSKLVIVE